MKFLANVFGTLAAFALLGVGLGAWSILSGEWPESAWSTVGWTALVTVVLGGLSTLFQYAGRID